MVKIDILDIIHQAELEINRDGEDLAPEQPRKIILRVAKRTKLTMKEVCRLLSPYLAVPEEISDPMDAVIRKFKRDQINKVLEELPPREANIIRMRYGLGEKSRPSTDESTLEEVGAKCDVTRERIRQIEAKVLRKLRHPHRDTKLRPIMDD